MSILQPTTKSVKDALELTFDDSYVIDYNREPIILELAECNVKRGTPNPNVDRTLDKELYGDFIRLIYETANTNLWAHATFRSYRDMCLAQRYLLNNFRDEGDRMITTRTIANGNHLYVRLA